MRCDLCRSEVEETRECKVCGVHFCEDCGNLEKSLCGDCESYEEEGVNLWEE